MNRNIFASFCIAVLLVLCGDASAADSRWTDPEIKEANTASAADYLTDIEKETLLYINLARMYPKKFAEIEIPGYYGPAKYGSYLKGSRYIDSLIIHLNRMTPVKPLIPDKDLTVSAKCFAKEQGESGEIGHVRRSCEKINVAECCSYGMDTARDIVLQLLIDHDVPSLGHRINCLNGSYVKAGLGYAPHKIWGQCMVIDSIW